MHWACKRNHTSIIRFLISNGADSNIKTFKDESAASLASSEEALLLLDCPLVERPTLETQNNLDFVPNYLRNPPFPYVYQDIECAADKNPLINAESRLQSTPATVHKVDDTGCEVRTINPECSTLAKPLVLKVRVHESRERDFIEVEIASMTYQTLLETCAEELNLNVSEISKIRKLPNVLVRNDRDVCRMSSGQELEVVKSSLGAVW